MREWGRQALKLAPFRNAVRGYGKVERGNFCGTFAWSLVSVVRNEEADVLQGKKEGRKEGRKEGMRPLPKGVSTTGNREAEKSCHDDNGHSTAENTWNSCMMAA